MLPLHLFAFGIMTAITIAAVVLLPLIFGIDVSGLLFILGGLELMYLGFMTRSKLFSRAINAKYHTELNEYYTLKEIVEVYNSMSAHAQERFEHYRKMLSKVKENYSQLNSSFPDIVRDYLRRIDRLQLSYIRLLAREDKFSIFVDEKENPQMWKAQIEAIERGMANDSERVKRLKMGRAKMLRQRIDNYNKKLESRKEISLQIHNIEEMIKFFHDQPISREESLQTSQALQDLIDETTDLHDTLSEIDQVMANEIAALESDSNYSGDMGSYTR